jgi:hypothetical protein
MQLWESLEFGARALKLKSTVARSREEIDALGRAQLQRMLGATPNSGAKSWQAFPNIRSN